MFKVEGKAPNYNKEFYGYYLHYNKIFIIDYIFLFHVKRKVHHRSKKILTQKIKGNIFYLYITY